MSQYDVNFWNDRYSEPDGLAYGEAPNGFLAETIKSLKESSTIPDATRVLCLAEGEGRNAIYLAGLGYNVYAVDISSVGMKKLQDRAASAGLSELIHAEVVDLDNYDLKKDAGPEGWDVIISIYAHTPPNIRSKVHRAVVETLKPGGHFILEAYTPANIGRGTGGPQGVPLCMTSTGLADELVGLEILKNCECERVVNEGKYHNGLASVVEFIGKKP